MSVTSPVLEVAGLSRSFAIESSMLKNISDRLKGSKPQALRALHDVSFSIAAGETLGVLGESGSGKSTLARVLMGIYEPDSGTAKLCGREMFGQHGLERLAILKDMQMVFQDPFGSLDPRMTVRQIICEPLKIHKMMPGKDLDTFLLRTLTDVGLEAGALDLYPSEFSGGQRQRIGICRALMLNPKLLIADEAVSALDVSVQAQILELLISLRAERNLAMLFISHDVAVVRQISDRIILLYRGHLVEELNADQLLTHGCHPYTKHLLEAALFLREGAVLPKTTAAVAAPVSVEGCCYRAVCPQAANECQHRPTLREIAPNHRVACHFANETRQ
ncbi:MAG TPA: peptide ABC transporter ATP-binding protein [Candidatus Riflebacteria bacterium]|jgi:oligopeptide/dipeptide ABC transporter ATP-binding protein|nr:peptide ABC transporter ATP-binding protein [Candidatus Riflebacteria bacterium]